MSKLSELKVEVFSGLFWTFFERIAAQGISFIISIILARILLPEEYGQIAIILVFINIFNVFVTSGFGESLVQKSNTTEKDFSTVFFCSLFVSILVYIIIHFLAPFIGEFYSSPTLVSALRVLALKIPISSISTIQHAYVEKKFLFKKFFFSTLGGTIISGIIGIILAINRYGIWALVFQYLINTFVDTLILFLIVPWKPSLQFSWESVRMLLGYGWKITLSALINNIYGEMYSLVIGKIYSSEQLAYYNRGNQFPSLIISNIDTSMSKVFFPTMSKLKENLSELKEFARKALKTTTFVIFPLLSGLIVIAEPLVTTVLTNKWIFCIPYLRLACLVYMLQPIQTINWQVIKAVGRSDLCLKLEIIKKIIGVFMLVTSIKFGLICVAFCNVISTVFFALINSFPNNRLIKYSIGEQIHDLSKSLFSSAIMSAIIWTIMYWNVNNIIRMIVQIFVGVISYIGLSILIKNESLNQIVEIISKQIHKLVNN